MPIVPVTHTHIHECFDDYNEDVDDDDDVDVDELKGLHKESTVFQTSADKRPTNRYYIRTQTISIP